MFPRFTFGVAPADLMADKMAAKSFSSTYLQAGIGGLKTGNYHAVSHGMRPGRQMIY